MAEHKRLDLDVFAAAGRAAGCAFAVFYQEFVDGVAYQLGEAEENDVPLGGMAKSTQEVIPRAFAALYQSIIDGFDQYGIPTEDPTDDAEPQHCAACWCNSCENLEDCAAFPASDGITPPPCAACGDFDIMAPVGIAPKCGHYVPSAEALEIGTALDPEDGNKIRVSCLACWCRDCGNFETCVVERDGFDEASEPCPCDGCEGANRYMPREKPPTCGNYIARAAK